MSVDGTVRVWEGRLDKSFKVAYKIFVRFLNEGLVGELEGLGPDELVDFQVDAKGRDRYLILRAAQSWVDGLDLRVGSKQLYLTYIRSFFLHNLAELPHDRSFSFRSSLPCVVGRLDLESLQRILLNSNKMYKAVFLMMSQGIMGEGELVYVSKFQASHVLKCLGKGGLFKVSLPGRKQTRNVKSFYTVLSCKGDWADAMRDYLRSLKNVPSDVLFRNQRGTPLNENNIRYYFHWRAVESGVIKQHTPKCRLCGGETLRKRNRKKIIEYVCKDCNCVSVASDVTDGYFWGGIRYGVNPHEIRDLMRSRWQVSGADPTVAEFIMGHDIDSNHYNKFMRYEPAYLFSEYRKALPWLNVLSCDPNKVDKSEIEGRLEARDAEMEVVRNEMVKMRRFFENPKLQEILEKLKKE